MLYSFARVSVAIGFRLVVSCESHDDHRRAGCVKGQPAPMLTTREIEANRLASAPTVFDPETAEWIGWRVFDPETVNLVELDQALRKLRLAADRRLLIGVLVEHEIAKHQRRVADGDCVSCGRPAAQGRFCGPCRDGARQDAKLKAKKSLRENCADAVADVASMAGENVTAVLRADLKELRADVNARISETNARIDTVVGAVQSLQHEIGTLRWMIVVGLTLLGALLAISTFLRGS